MRKLLAIIAVIAFSSANAFAPEMGTIPLPTLNEWGTVGVVVLLGLIGVFFLVKRRKQGCCN